MWPFLGFKYYVAHIIVGTAKREIVLSPNYKSNNFSLENMVVYEVQEIMNYVIRIIKKNKSSSNCHNYHNGDFFLGEWLLMLKKDGCIDALYSYFMWEFLVYIFKILSEW